jgi:hypothetical protein
MAYQPSRSFLEIMLVSGMKKDRPSIISFIKNDYYRFFSDFTAKRITITRIPPIAATGRLPHKEMVHRNS